MDNILFDLSEKERDSFRRISRRLLAETYIVKDKDSRSRDDYLFIKKHIDLLNEVFSTLGYVVSWDKTSEIAMLSVDAQGGDIGCVNRVPVSYRQTKFVAILWQYYYKAMRRLNECVIITNEELQYEMAVGNLLMTKAEVKEVILKLKKHNIVSNDTLPDITLPEGQLYIYPSILCVLNMDMVIAVYEDIKTGVLPRKEEKIFDDIDEEDSENDDFTEDDFDE